MPPLFADAATSGIDGFLGTRASLMLDVVLLAMLAVLPGIGLGVAAAKRGRFLLHKRIQLALAAALFVAVLAFEVDMRLFTDWRLRAAPSPYFQGDGWNAVWISLVVHLACAVPTLGAWIAVVALALRRFPSPPAPGPHSRLHKRLGWAAALGMLLTAVTGWLFYGLAFVAG